MTACDPLQLVANTRFTSTIAQRTDLHLFAKIAVGVLALIGVFYIGVTIFVTFFINSCDTYVLAELQSPNREYNAMAEIRSCEDDSFTELEVYVSHNDSPDVRHGAPLATNPATTELYLEWRSSDTLVVRYPSALKIENWPPSLGDVRLLFEPTDGAQ